MYSLGIILFELFCPFSTEMERVKSISDLRQSKIPRHFAQTWPEQVSRGHVTSLDSKLGIVTSQILLWVSALLSAFVSSYTCYLILSEF